MYFNRLYEFFLCCFIFSNIIYFILDLEIKKNLKTKTLNKTCIVMKKIIEGRITNILIMICFTFNFQSFPFYEPLVGKMYVCYLFCYTYFQPKKIKC